VLHRIHRLAASIIGVYALVHLFNHLMAVRSVASHIGFMESVRHISRIPAVEAVLLACVAYQVGSGLYFVARRWRERRELFDRLQAISGAYLAFFLLVHVASVLYGRSALGLDTNFYFAAAGLHISPFQVFFIPYYGMAVVALMVHASCAFHYLGRARIGQNMRDRIGYFGVAGGIVLASLILAAFSGALYRVEIPQEYRATFK
jgi:succinate dehydrogenase/fumarate reductase cytochrome b subunit